MKRQITFALILTAMAFARAGTQPITEDFNIIMEPTWKDLEQNEAQAKKFGGKWILAGTITFKKKAQNKVHLERLYFQWDGQRIDNLVASLYTSESHKDFLPIQENLICDGRWNKSQQQLIFNFAEKQLLTFKNCYFLVLTVCDEIEPILKTGKFELVTAILPEQFKECLQNGHLCLDFNPKKTPTFKHNVRVAKR